MRRPWMGFVVLCVCWAAMAVPPLRAQGVDPGLSARLQRVLDSVARARSLRGISACLILPGQGEWVGGTGDSHPGAPMHPDLLLGIGSNTKTFTAALLLRLVDEGNLALDARLGSLLPPYPYVDSSITVRQLLNHTSGIFDVTDAPGYRDSILAAPTRVWTADAVIRAMIGPPRFVPGTDWSYSNTNYLLAGLVAERVGGLPYATLLRQKILDPLEMDSTLLDVAEPLPFAIAHPWSGSLDQFSVPRTATYSAAGAAGALFSTARELARWYQNLFGGRVLSPTSFAAMQEWVGSEEYGLGMSRKMMSGYEVRGHTGEIRFYSSMAGYVPALGLSMAVLINQLPASASAVAALLLKALHEDPGTGLDIPVTAASFTIYPLPMRQGGATLTLTLLRSERLRISVTDLLGREQGHPIEVLAQPGSWHHRLPSLPAGLYRVTVDTERGRLASRLLPCIE